MVASNLTSTWSDGPGRVLERVTDGVTDDGCGVGQ